MPYGANERHCPFCSGWITEVSWWEEDTPSLEEVIEAVQKELPSWDKKHICVSSTGGLGISISHKCANATNFCRKTRDSETARDSVPSEAWVNCKNHSVVEKQIYWEDGMAGGPTITEITEKADLEFPGRKYSQLEISIGLFNEVVLREKH